MTDNSIHSSAIISGDVTLGSGNTIGAHVVIVGPVTIGNDNWIGTGVVIGAPPEIRGVRHPGDAEADEAGNGIVIGDRNVLREYAQIHHGWKGVTTLGDDIFLMNQCYVAHDCTIGNRATLASSVLLAGHVRVGEGSNLGLGALVHQGRSIGGGAMLGMGAVVTHDIPPYSKAYGNPARVHGANTVGMERAGVTEDMMRIASRVYSRPDVEPDDLVHLAENPQFSRYFEEWSGRQ